VTVTVRACEIQPVPELPPHRKHGYADSKRDSKMTKIKFPVDNISNRVIKFLISPIPEARPQVAITMAAKKF
jgi:hypothetical protein